MVASVQLLLDALDAPNAVRSDVLGFTDSFKRRRWYMVRKAGTLLYRLGSFRDFEDAVLTATGNDAIWRGLYSFAKHVLAQLPTKPAVH